MQLILQLAYLLRITPDHGPNEIMVGKGKSNPTSLIKAMSFLDKR